MPQSPAASAAPKKRGLFAFLFKSVLGCAAFAVGALVVLVLLLPTLLQSPVRSHVESAFAGQFHGSLAVDHLELGWFSPLEVRNAVVRDPEGREIARATVVAPDLRTLIGALGSGKLGRVEIDVEADLVADDAGVTNLERALAPRATKPESNVRVDDESGTPLAERLANLDTEIVVRGKRIAWSDAQTRRAGAPFELRELEASLVATPGAPLKVGANARITAEQAGRFDVEATLGGPIQPELAWPFGPVDANVRIEGFSSAMVDGLAGLKGGLVEVFGPRFDVVGQVKQLTDQRGEVALTWSSPRASVAVEGRVEGGMLRSGDAPFLVASFPAPSALLATLLPSEPARVTMAATDAPCSVRVTQLALPIAPLRESGKGAWTKALEGLAVELDATLPATITVAHPSLEPLGGATVADTNVRVSVGSNRARAEVDARALGAPERNLSISVVASDVTSALAAGGVPPLDVDVGLRGLETARFDGLVAPRSLANVLGTTFDVALEARGASDSSGAFAARLSGTNATVDARAALAAGVVRVAGEDRVRVEVRDVRPLARVELEALVPEGTRIDVGEGALVLEVRDASFRLPDGAAAFDPLASAAGKLTLTLPTVDVEREGSRLAHVSGLDVGAELASGAANVRVRAAFDGGASGASGSSTSGSAAAPGAPASGGAGAPSQSASGSQAQAAIGSLALDATIPDVAKVVRDGVAAMSGVDLRLDVRKLSTGMLAALAEPLKLAERALGPELSIALAVEKASLASGRVRLGAEAQNANASFTAQLADGVLRARGEDALSASARVPAAVADELVAAHLPAGTKVAWRDGTASLSIAAREIALPMPDLANGAPFDVAKLLEGLDAQLELAFAGVRVENDATRAAKIEAHVLDVVARAKVAPKQPLEAVLDARITAGGDGALHASAKLAEPFAMLADPSAKLAPIDAQVELRDVDPRALDALLGERDLVAGLCGGPLKLAIDARGLSLAGGNASMTVASPALDARIVARVDGGVLTCAGDEGIDLSCAPTSAFFASQVVPRLPEGTKLELEGGAQGGRVSLRVRDVRVPIDGDEPVLARIARVASRVELVVPAIAYSDAATSAAGRPIVLRETSLSALFAPSAAPTVRLQSTIDDATPGAIAVEATALDPLSKLGEENGIDTFRARVAVKATNVPTAIVDLVAGQDGLLVEALGTRCEVLVDAPDLSLERGAFTASMRSDLHSVKAEGRLEARVLRIDKVDGVLAEIGLGPIGSKKLVGSLVPMLVDVKKNEGAAPAKFAVDGLSYPLDGDLSKLDAVVRLDLGEISYALLPGLDQFLGSAASMKSTLLKPIAIPIEKGIARYDRLPIRFGASEVPFRGTFNLVDRSFSLGADVPLALLGKKVNAKLDAVRQYLPADLAVPLEIRGTWDKPRISISESFLKDVVGKAAEKGLGGLLDGLLDKKKKD